MGRAPWWLPWSVYGPLGVLGAALAWYQHGSVFVAPAAQRFSPARFSLDPTVAFWVGMSLSAGVVAVTVLSTRWLVEHAAWARALHGTLRGALLGASSQRLFTLAVLSSFTEELFFRAALLPYAGLFASSLVFGALHVASRDSFLPWMLWAALMGLVFGALYLASGSLWPPIVAHAAINWANMRYLCKREYVQLAAPRRAPHGERWRRL